MKLSSLQKGLVGHWTMSQDSLKGSLLADKTPYENDGTIYGATFTTDRKGKANSAMSFDGVNDYISYANNGSLQITENITIGAWVKTNNLNSIGSGIVCKSDFNSHFGDYEIHQFQNKIRFIINNDSPINRLDSSTALTTSWTHVVATYDGTTKKIYINGLLDNSASFSGPINNNYSNFEIGAYYSNSFIFNGSIDDVRIYNRALSETEIKTLYNSYNPKIIL